MDVKMSMSRRDGGWVGKRLLPLIVIGEERAGKVLVVGISPLHSTIGRAALDDPEAGEGAAPRERVEALVNFNMAFRLAANSVSRNVDAGQWQWHKRDCFDAHVIEIPKEVCSPFDFVYELSTVLNAAAI